MADKIICKLCDEDYTLLVDEIGFIKANQQHTAYHLNWIKDAKDALISEIATGVTMTIMNTPNIIARAQKIQAAEVKFCSSWLVLEQKKGA
jgi:hypothetical protein